MDERADGRREQKRGSLAQLARAESILRVPLSPGTPPDITYANQRGNQDPVSGRGPSTFLQFLKSFTHCLLPHDYSFCL